MALMMEEQIRKETAMDIARQMIVAARTAPKACGKDSILAAVADQETMLEIAKHMRTMHAEGRVADFFLRDAANLETSDALVLLGVKIAPKMLDNCGLCGFTDCQEKMQHPKHPCSFNTADLGIATGSAVSIAADCRADNRIMFSVGMAAREMGLLGEDAAIIYGIPLSFSGKSRFFDRKMLTC